MKNHTAIKQGAFENYSREEPIEKASDRSFGLVFAGFFTIVGLLKYWPHVVLGYHWFGLAALLLILAFTYPKLLSPFNRLWMKFGSFLHKIMNPLIMGAVFYGVFTPMGLLARLRGFDPLKLHFDKACKSYWIKREKTTSSLLNQF